MASGKHFFRSSHCTRKRSAYFSIQTGVLLGWVTSAAELIKIILVPNSFLAKNTVGTVTPAPVVMMQSGRFLNIQKMASAQFTNNVQGRLGWKLVRNTCSLSAIKAFVDVVFYVSQ